MPSSRCIREVKTPGLIQLDAAVAAGIAEFGKIDILIANSGLAGKVTGVTLPVDAGHLTLSGYNPVSTR